MITTQSTKVRLRNKITGLYFVEGKNFSGTESEATVYETNSPSCIVVMHSFDNVEQVADSSLRRVTKRKDGIEKIEKLSFGSTRRNFHGEAASGHWVVRGYRKDGVFKQTMKELREALALR